jgi:MIP family channel proteins
MSGNIRSFLAEFIGTFAVVWIAAGAVCVEATLPGQLGLLGTALAYGAAVALATYALGPASGGHFNPAVTIALFISRRLDGLRCVFYLASQLLGSAAAGFLLAKTFPPALSSAAPYLGACRLAGVGFRMATLLEAISVFLIMLVYCSARFSGRARSGWPIAMGFATTACALAIGPLTGAALNPARFFGPALASGHWADFYVYCAGPISGAILAALFHKIFLSEEKTRPV